MVCYWYFFSPFYIFLYILLYFIYFAFYIFYLFYTFFTISVYILFKKKRKNNDWNWILKAIFVAFFFVFNISSWNIIGFYAWKSWKWRYICNQYISYFFFSKYTTYLSKIWRKILAIIFNKYALIQRENSSTNANKKRKQISIQNEYINRQLRNR